MKRPSVFKVAILILTMTGSAFAGGAACEFQSNALPLLKKSPALADVLQSQFVVAKGGMMGPMDAPFRGGRLYTYMDFKAEKKGDAKEKFIVRIHFTRKEEALEFKSLEILPVEEGTQ